MFKGKNCVSMHLYPGLFEGNLMKYYVQLIYNQAALVVKGLNK
jgi:hypothetical protein